MSIIHKLARIGLSAILAVGLGMQCVASAPVLFDTVESDSKKHLQAKNHALWEGVEFKAMSYSVNQALTPSFKPWIQERKAQNSHTVGWLQVPGTGINSQIVQNPRDNNSFSKKNNYYLNTNFFGQPDKDGTFCMDFRATLGNRNDLSRVTAIYGHSWDDNPNGGLFSPLKKYRDPSFAKNHPYLYFSTEAEDMVWEVFAVFDTTVYLPYVRPNLSVDEFNLTLDMIHDLTYYNYDLAVNDTDKFLVLSTCTFSVQDHPSLPELNDYRFVVMAKLVDSQATLKERAVFAINSAPISPDATRRLWYI